MSQRKDYNKAILAAAAIALTTAGITGLAKWIKSHAEKASENSEETARIVAKATAALEEEANK